MSGEDDDGGWVAPVSHRRRALAWSILGLSCLLYAEFLILGVSLSPRPASTTDVAFNTLMLLFLGTGTVLALRKPENLVGWSLMFFAFSGFLAGGAMAYGRYALDQSPELPLAGLAGAIDGAVGDWLSPVFLVFVFLFFPDGLLPYPRWRWYLAALVVIHGTGFLTTLFRPGIGLRVAAENPLGIEGTQELFNSVRDSASALNAILVIFLVGAFVVRRRRASSVERLQLKWLFFTASLIAAAFVVIAVIEFTGSNWGDSYGEYIWFGILVFVVGSIAISVLKYRLYDIDVVINRTLVYGVLTGVLALLYAGLVAAFSVISDGFTGDSDLAVAASTLAVAGLFRPLRARVQDFIDRRFYRAKFDAAHTLEEFNRRIRDEVDLENLQGDLLSVVNQTLHPAHASLWLRPVRAAEE